MPKETAHGRYDSIRTFFSFRDINKFLFWRNNNQAGFTLVELVLVIGILSVLGVLLIMVINPVTQLQKANDAKRKSELAQLQKTLEQYYSDNGKYPAASSTKIAPGGVEINWGSDFPSYNTKVPADPSSSRNYAYSVGSYQQSYRIYASLERGHFDKQACCTTSGCSCTGATSLGLTCGPASPLPVPGCNYGVSSSNVSP